MADWRRLAGRVGLDEDVTVGRIDDLAGRLPAAIEQAASTEAVRELGSDLPERLAEAVAHRAKVCRSALV